MRCAIPAAVLLLLTAIVACGGGALPARISQISGPQSVCASTTVEYKVSAGDDLGAIYLWTVAPVSAGKIADPHLGTVIFTAIETPSDLNAVIRATVQPSIGLSEVRELQITINAAGVNRPPYASAFADPEKILPGAKARFYNDSTDPDCWEDIAEWEWDLSYDPREGFVPTDEIWEPALEFPLTGTYMVQLRVTDSTGKSDMLDEPLVVEVAAGQALPVAVAVAQGFEQTVGDAMLFDGRNSYDPDGGAIVKYEWDWENDGIFDDEGETFEHAWVNPGIYTVHFRVTDDEGDTDTLPRPLRIAVRETGWAHVRSDIEDAEGQAVDVCESGDLAYAGHFSYDMTWFVLVGTLDPTGEEVWEQTWWDTETGHPAFSTDLAIDNEERVFCAGYFAFGEQRQAFVIEYDASGELLRTPTWESGMCEGIEICSEGGSYFVGTFSGTMDFDLGEGTDERIALGGTDAFLAKLDPEGGLVWARTWGGESWDDCTDLAVGPSGDIFVTGSFVGLADLNPGEGVDPHFSSGESDVYLSRFDPWGNLVWARTWGGDATDKSSSIAIDQNGDAYVTGYFQGAVDFDPGAGVRLKESVGWRDAYVTKIDSSGEFEWARTWGTSGEDQWNQGCGVAAGPDGKVYVTGEFYKTVDFDPGPGGCERTSNGQGDAFLSAFDSSGDFIWVTTWGGLYWDTAEDVAVDEEGYCFVTGGFSHLVDFDLGTGINEHWSAGLRDIYVLKIAGAECVSHFGNRR